MLRSDQEIRYSKKMSQYSFEDLLMYSLIALSTIPFFKSVYGIALIVGCILYKRKYLSLIVKPELVIVLLLIITLEVYHLTYFAGYELWVSRQILTFFIAGAFVVCYLKLNFLNIYINVMYKITWVSFVFFGLLLVSPEITHSIANSVPDFFITREDIYGQIYARMNPIIFNFDYNFFKIRNNGPFWEPTVFASLLLIAQMFNFYQNKSFFNKTGVVFTIGIMTTFSTTVFIGYFILILGSLIISEKIKFIFKLIFLFITIGGGMYLFSNLPFLEEKINEEIVNIDSNMETRGDSRMASAILDLTEITQDQTDFLFGRGSSRISRIGGIDKQVLRNCGTTALLVEWGICFFCIYVSLLFFTFYQLSLIYDVNVIFAVVCTFLILLVSFSEVFLDLPLFHSFIFLGFIVRRARLADKNSKSSLINHTLVDISKTPYFNPALRNLQSVGRPN